MSWCLKSFLVGCAGLMLPAPAMSAEYHLAAQDKLRIKVIEWRAGKGEYQEWAALGGEYMVGAAGSVSLPLLGDLPVEGKTPAEVAAAISDGLRKRAGLINQPDTSVEVVQFRPIYVIGSVERPGEYPYRPGISVLQAVSIASGHYREAGLSRLERDRIVAAGSVEGARLEMRRALVRRARLLAELNDATKIEVPDELRGDADAPRLIADEAEIMRARTEALRSQLAALTELKNLLAAEVESLGQKIASQDKQIALARRELKGVGSLVDKGLAVTSREYTLERTVAELESKMLDLETATLRARQEISKTERNALDLMNDRKAKIATELQETVANLDQLTAKLKTSRGLLDEAAVTAPRLASERSAWSARKPVYSIVRRSGRESVEIVADEATAVQPGDVVRVEFTPPAVESAPQALSTAPQPPAAAQQRPSPAAAVAASESPPGPDRRPRQSR